MVNKHGSYLSPRLAVVVNAEKGGYGVVASEAVANGELLAVWSGVIYTEAQMDTLSAAEKSHSVEVEEGLYLVSLVPDEPADFINHSCEPNAGMSGQICIVAMRAIAPGEEINIDYAMVDTSEYDPFDCACGAAGCRGTINGLDYRRPELWARYAGYFAPHVQRKIDRLNRSS